MDNSLVNISAGFFLPIFIILAFVYWTIKVPYQKRFLPAIMLVFLAGFVFFVPLILASLDVIGGGFGIAILSIYFSVFLGTGVVVNICVAALIKKEKESSNPELGGNS
ncbi:hypothetical protein HP456_18345 [Bacillus haikouensis]|uniref:hypothetical protein n=1 Tax=Bacillus haikouensis TaxID=1510468 RepID=UPI0015555C9B|nr:hypothetical protein [Bacillus haikouensis]NQD67871.1 hypothetical protein [Bacillus haikouensis]